MLSVLFSCLSTVRLETPVGRLWSPPHIGLHTQCEVFQEMLEHRDLFIRCFIITFYSSIHIITCPVIARFMFTA